MSKIVLLVGLPGSGKTWLAKHLSETSHRPSVTFDDPTENEFQAIIEAIQEDKDVYMSDPWFCYLKNLRLAKQRIFEWVAKISQRKVIKPVTEVIYFENNPEACLRNVRYRADGLNGDVEGFIRKATLQYVVPHGVTARQIWQPPSTT